MPGVKRGLASPLGPHGLLSRRPTAAWRVVAAAVVISDFFVATLVVLPLVAAVLGSALLLSIPTAQYLLLRSAIPTAGRWIWVNVLAWSLGICWTFAPSPLVNASTPFLWLIGIYAMAGLLMATTVAVITGLCWLSWLRSGTVRTVSGVAYWRSRAAGGGGSTRL
jgi:hypothetical protein